MKNGVMALFWYFSAIFPKTVENNPNSPIELVFSPYVLEFNVTNVRQIISHLKHFQI